MLDATPIPDITDVLRALLRELRRSRSVDPELLPARDAARLAGVSTASWHRLCAAGKAPAPVRLSGAVRWRRAELLAWISAGCLAPARKAK